MKNGRLEWIPGQARDDVRVTPDLIRGRDDVRVTPDLIRGRA